MHTCLNEFIPVPCNLIGFGHFDGTSQFDFYLTPACSSSCPGTMSSAQGAQSSPKLLRIVVRVGSRMSLQ